ncbi:MAG TPA: thiamine phosphate synthase [Desulfuromonadaceae bacterium]
MPAIDFSLYLITDRTQTHGRPLAAVVREALEGGVRAVQLREKDLSGRDLFSLAQELRAITREYGARLIINDRPDIALVTEADGVHLGAASLPVAAARTILGPERLIGYSAHAVAEARQAEAEGADFATFGPVYPTPSKAAYGAPLGPEKLAEAAATLGIPVFALGGVKKTSIAELLTAGARGIALISAVIAADDPRAAAATLLETLEQHVIHP